jgi:hypothetical protein
MRVSAGLSKSAVALLGLTILLSGRPAAQTKLNDVRREKAS